MSRKWQLQKSIFLKAIAGIQYNFKFECRLGHIFICWCSFACNYLSQNHLNSVPEHRAPVGIWTPIKTAEVRSCAVFNWAIRAVPKLKASKRQKFAPVLTLRGGSQALHKQTGLLKRRNQRNLLSVTFLLQCFCAFPRRLHPLEAKSRLERSFVQE